MEEKTESLSSQEILKTERYLWIARAFSAVAVLAVVANVILFSAIGSLYPLVRVQPFYLNILDKNQQVIDITPIKAEELQSPTVMEALMRQYVLARYEIGTNIQEIEDRWGPDGIVALMSSQGVYSDFSLDQARLLEEDIKKEGLTVEAFIINARDISKGNHLTWALELSLKEMRQNSTDIKERKLLVTLRAKYDPLYKETNRTTWSDRLKNPLGFRVTDYGEKEI